MRCLNHHPLDISPSQCLQAVQPACLGQQALACLLLNLPVVKGKSTYFPGRANRRRRKLDPCFWQLAQTLMFVMTHL